MKKIILLAGTISLLAISCRQQEMITAEDSATLQIVQKSSATASTINNNLAAGQATKSEKDSLKRTNTNVGNNTLLLADPGETIPPPRR